MAPVPPVSDNHGFGMDYDEEKALEYLRASSDKKKEEESDDSGEEEEWLLPQYMDFLKAEEEKKNGMKEQDVSALTEDDHKLEAVADVVKACKFCENSPCLLNKDSFYEDMVYVAEGFEDCGLTNKQIRFELYGFASKFLFGSLGRGVRKKIPHCIIAEIHDVFPAKNVNEYVGFKEAPHDT
jgi:hypothetical protein